MAYFIFTQHEPSHASSQCARECGFTGARQTRHDDNHRSIKSTIPYEECAIRLLRTLSSRAEPFFRRAGISLIGPDA